MTRYEAIHDELFGLRTQLAIALIAPTCVVAVVVGYLSEIAGAIAVLGSVVVSPFAFHFLWRLLFEN